MKAMIFAAGKGTRLQPLTNTMPKALVPVGGRPLLERLIRKLIASGCNEIIVNVHYFAQQIADFLQVNRNFGIRIELSDETDKLLDTGGGLAKAAWFFDDGKPFIVHNVDIVSSINLQALYHAHQSSNAAATLAVSERATSRYLLFDNSNRLQGWINESTGERKPINKTLEIAKLRKYAFSGIQVISPELLECIKKHNGAFSIIDLYLEQMEQMPISSVCATDEIIIDVGKMATFEEANDFIKKAGL